MHANAGKFTHLLPLAHCPRFPSCRCTLLRMSIPNFLSDPFSLRTCKDGTMKGKICFIQRTAHFAHFFLHFVLLALQLLHFVLTLCSDPLAVDFNLLTLIKLG